MASRSLRGGYSGRLAPYPKMDPIDEVGTFAAFGAFLGALAAYGRIRVDDAGEWAMHGMVVGGAIGVLVSASRALL